MHGLLTFLPPNAIIWIEFNHMQILWTHGHERIACVSRAILACQCVF